MHHSQPTTKFSAEALPYLSLSVRVSVQTAPHRKPSFTWLMNGTRTWLWKPGCCHLFWPIKGIWYSSIWSPFGESAACWSQWLSPYLIWRLTIWPAPMCGLGLSHLSCSPSHIRSPPGIYSWATPFHHFMNSIFDVVLSSASWFVLYADDMVLYKPIKNNQDLLDLQNDIDAICSWTSTKSLHLIATKTNSILITHKKHRLIIIGRYHIPSLKVLGVVITDNLTWSPHIESTCLKAKKQLSLIHRHYHQAIGLHVRDYTSSRFSHTLTTAKRSTRRNWTLYRLLPQKLFCRTGQLLGNKDSWLWNGHALKTNIKYKIHVPQDH